jgi:hypothetical protein
MNFPYVVCEYRASVRSYNAISVRGLRNREFMPSSSKTRGTRLRGPIFCHPQRHRCLVNTHNTSPFPGSRARPNGVPSHHKPKVVLGRAHSRCPTTLSDAVPRNDVRCRHDWRGRPVHRTRRQPHTSARQQLPSAQKKADIARRQQGSPSAQRSAGVNVDSWRRASPSRSR